MGKKQAEENNKKQGAGGDPGKTIEALFKISDAVSNTRDLDELYLVIHKSLDEILNVDNFYIALHHKEKDSITFPYHVDEMDENPKEILNFSKTASLTGLVIKARKPLILYAKDVVQLTHKLKKKEIGTVPIIWLGAPLIIKDRVKGAVVIQSYKSPEAYGKKDLDLLNSISQHIALAIERKESEDELADQQNILENILESLPIGVGLVQNRTFKWVNNELVKMFGYQSKKEFVNKNTQMIYSDIDDYNRAGEIIYNNLSSDNIVEFEIDLIKKDKSVFPGHLRLNCKDTSNPMAWTIATIVDISQRKVIEKEKFERERLQGVLEMAGAVCHEINQPLQAIIGYSELLLMDSNPDNIEDNNIHSIKSQATRLGKITKKLSNITRYRTIDYPGNTKIVDIWGASGNTEH